MARELPEVLHAVEAVGGLRMNLRRCCRRHSVARGATATTVLRPSPLAALFWKPSWLPPPQPRVSASAAASPSPGCSPTTRSMGRFHESPAYSPLVA
jgi:hypothetical protein